MVKKKGLLIKRSTTLVSPRKIGIDSGPIIHLIDNYNLFSDRALGIFEEENVCVTHKICMGEIVNVLNRDYDWKRSEAKKKLDQFIKDNNINVLTASDVDYEKLNQMKELCKKNNVEFHHPDSIILYHFKEEGVNKVWSTNNHFLEAGRLFGMESEKFPTIKHELDQKFKKLFKRH